MNIFYGWLAASVLFLAACSAAEKAPAEAGLGVLDEIPPADWTALAEKTIFFGHQSVGGNIVEGLRDVLGERPGLGLRLEEAAGPDEVRGPGLAHAWIGRNLEPLSKIEDFDRWMRTGLGDRVGLAFFKFCYVDVTARMDEEALFRRYAEAMDALQSAYPNVRFLHVTVPLTAPGHGLKARILRLLGDRRVDKDNRQRERYNDRLRQRFGPDSVFDLAGLESGPAKENAGGAPRALARAYTEDGGHLNEAGRKRVALGLLLFLARQGGR